MDEEYRRSRDTFDSYMNEAYKLKKSIEAAKPEDNSPCEKLSNVTGTVRVKKIVNKLVEKLDTI